MATQAETQSDRMEEYNAAMAQYNAQRQGLQAKLDEHNGLFEERRATMQRKNEEMKELGEKMQDLRERAAESGRQVRAGSGKKMNSNALGGMIARPPHLPSHLQGRLRQQSCPRGSTANCAHRWHFKRSTGRGGGEGRGASKLNKMILSNCSPANHSTLNVQRSTAAVPAFQVQKSQQFLRDLQLCQHNKLAVFGGDPVTRLVEAIRRNVRRFHRPPIGPLGFHLALKEPRVSAERCTCTLRRDSVGRGFHISLGQ